MAFMLHLARRYARVASPPRQFPTAGFQVLDNALLVEEEQEPLYSPKAFYPARIGEVLNSRYQIVGKLGYGGYSTVWLGRDLIKHEYVILKLCRCDAPNIKREIEIYEHLNTLKTNHAGATLVRTLLGSFELENRQQTYWCLIHKPMGMSLARLRKKFPAQKLPEHILKLTVIHILIALEFLHTHANIIHADLQEKNILLGIEDLSILDEFEEAEHENPIARKIDGDRVIYETRILENTKKPGRPVLTDFGEARFGKTTGNGLIQPLQYRSPEVLLHMPWDYKVDIWNVGVMIWDLFQGVNMFKVREADNKPSKIHHLAHMVALLGTPPADFLQRSNVASEYFDTGGLLKDGTKVPKTCLEETESNLKGENQVMFLAFMRKMLKWKPEERSSAKDLLRDTWLRDGAEFADE